jgi:hypothetical protein
LDPLGGRLWTADEVADYLRVDKATLRRWRREGIGPPVIMAAPATPRYPENGLILWRRDNGHVMGTPTRLAS